MARNTLRGAIGAASRVSAWVPQLMASIAAADYLESGRLSFEIRSALRRAEITITDLERKAPTEAEQVADQIAAARASLTAQYRQVAMLLRAAPVLEAQDAGSEESERAWKEARRGAVGGLSSPSWTDEAGALAGSLGLGVVSIHAGDDGRRATDAEGANGVALGGAIYLHPERARPGTPEGREVLAHELVHLAQARLPTDHDAGRDAAEHEAAEIARVLARGGASPQPMRYIDLDRPAADTHAKVQVPSGTVDARGYINRTGNAVRINEAIMTEIGALVLPDPPAPRVRWTDSAPFRARLQRHLAHALGRAAKSGDLATRVVELTFPVSALEALNAIRIRAKEQPVPGVVLGPDLWQEPAGRAIADAVAMAIGESVVRIASQYVETVDAADRRRATDGWESAYELTPSHPMDVHVAAAVLGDDQGKSILAVTPRDTEKPRRRKKHAAMEIKRGWRNVTVHWMGSTDPALWNWVRVEPGDATLEEVSAAIYDGDTTRVPWLTAAPPYVALHPQRAASVAGAAKHRPAQRATAPADTEDRRSVGTLARTKSGDDAALAQSLGVALVHTAGSGARAEAEAALTDSAKQLAFVTEALLPWDLVGELAPAWGFEPRCRAAIATADDHALLAWARTAVGQQLNLFEIADAVATITQAIVPQRDGPVHDLLGDYARAAGAAHLTATGRAMLEAARRRQARLGSIAASRSVAVARVLVGEAQDATDASDQATAARELARVKPRTELPGVWSQATDAASAAENQGDLSRPQMRRDRDELTRGAESLDGQARQIRADSIAGKPTDANLVDETTLRADEIAFRARVRAVRLRVRELEHQAFAVDKSLLSKVVDLVDGQISSVEGFGVLIRDALDASIARIDIRATTAQQDLSAAEERHARREALAAAQAQLDRIGGMPAVTAFLNAAASIIQEHQFRVALLNLAAMIGVSIAAAATGGLVAQQVLGAEAAAGLAGTGITIGTEALVNTVVGAVLGGHDLQFRDLLENAIAGAASRLVMHPFAKSAGPTVASFERNVWKVTGTRLALAKTVEVGAEAVLQIAVNYTAAMATRLGGAPSQRTVDDWMIEGLGIALGRFVHGRMQRVHGRLKDLTDVEAKQLDADVTALAAASRALEAAPDEASAKTLLERAQALTYREQALLAARATSATGDAKSDAVARAEAAKGEAASALLEMADLAFGLGGFREVVAGAVYEGPPDAILSIVEHADSLGIEVVRHDQSTGRWTLRRKGKVVHVDEVRAGDHQQRVVLAGAEMEMVARAALVKSEPGVLDVFVHGSVDDFVIRNSSGSIRISHRSLAKAIAKSGLKYDRIRLIACGTGRHPKGVAQHLANALGVPVDAPSDAVYIHGNGKLTIGPDETRDTGHWVEHVPRPGELRSKVSGEPEPPSPRERLQQRRAGRVLGMGERSDPSASTVASVHRAAVAEVGAIPVAHVKAGTLLPGTADPIRHDTYFVTPADGERMIAAFAKLPEVSTRRFRKGLIVRWEASEWYFEYRADAVSTDGTVRTGQSNPLGLPQANVSSIEIWGFRGVRRIHGRDKTQWTAEEVDAVAEARRSDPLMYAGHVGISFDGGKTIWGFLPDKPKDMPKESFLDYLLQHHAVRGKVDNDTPIFRRAANYASAHGWSTELMSAVELVDTAEKIAAIESIKEMASGKHDKGYQMPLPQPVNGSYYQDSNGYDAARLANCAAFPPMVGVRVPELGGNLHTFMPELSRWSSADGPIDFRTATQDNQPEEP